ncbi:hypothetical protein OAE29_08205, partial [Octadecabacter sp.]|nr:hypothetical protein [Octadecabacter sp.]
MSSWTPTKYNTRNWAEYNLSLKKRGSLSIWFDPEMVWDAAPSGRRGRQQATNWLWTYNNDRPNLGIGGITPAMKLKLA